MHKYAKGWAHYRVLRALQQKQAVEAIKNTQVYGRKR